MGQTEIIVDMIQRQLLPQALLALAQRIDTPPHRRHMLADGQVDPLHERGVDLPAAGRQHLLHRLQGAEHHAVAHPYQPTAPYGLDHLRREELGQWHPARRRQGPCGLPTLGVNPVAEVRQQRRQVLPKTIGEKQRGTVGG